MAPLDLGWKARTQAELACPSPRFGVNIMVA